jgi:Phage terminase large subunit (GpA)
MSSTPNSPNHIFWQRMLAGSMTTFPLECPHCREWFPLEWVFSDNRAEFDDQFYGQTPVDYRSVVWDKDARGKNGQWIEEKVRASARFICPKNGCVIDENNRQAMMPKFEEHVGNEYASASAKSYRIPSLYAPRVTFGDLALKFLERGQDHASGLQTFTNSWLALPWQQIDMSIKNSDVRKLRDISSYGRGEIPHRPFTLAIGADVGDYRTHWEVGAIMESGEIFIVDWGTVLAPEDLLGLAGSLKYRISGTDEWLHPAQGLVDSRDQTLRIYAMCQRSRGFWWPSAGSDVNSGHWGHKYVETHGLDRFTFNVFAFKFELYVRAIKKQEAPRFYLPRDADEDLIHGHSGQQLATTGGKQQFKKLPDDHYGDCSLRLLLARNVFFWRAGRAQAGPDMVVEAPKIGTFPES